MNNIKKIQSNITKLCQSYLGDINTMELTPADFNYYRVDKETLLSVIERHHPEIIYICYQRGANNSLLLFEELLLKLNIPKSGSNILQQTPGEYIVAYLQDLSKFEPVPSQIL
jgi:hypothetical protein